MATVAKSVHLDRMVFGGRKPDSAVAPWTSDYPIAPWTEVRLTRVSDLVTWRWSVGVLTIMLGSVH
jgi:hypothetical protein